jgi:glycosyltransferase involved in cell wall biosynthesis
MPASERYPAARRRVKPAARALLSMAGGRRTRRSIVLEAGPIVPTGRHGVIGMTRASVRRSVRVSLCMIVRDEAASLARCLASAAAAVDEIVVVDTGSRDDGVAVARAHGANVIEAPWTDDFAAARNVALEHTGGAWVLTLDADETLTADAARTLRTAIGEAGAPALRLPIEELGPSNEVEAVHFAVRLFRRLPAHRWQRAVCERLTAPATEYAALPIRHHGYADRVVRYAKLDRNRMLLERAVAATPADAELRQRLASTMLALGDPYAAAAHAEAALRRTRSTMTGLLAIDTLARARFAAGDLAGAMNACRTALALRPDWIDPRLVLAEASQRAGRIDDALLHYARFLADRERLAADASWPVRLPRLATLRAEPFARAELASVHAAVHRADHRHAVLVGTA